MYHQILCFAILLVTYHPLLLAVSFGQGGRSFSEQQAFLKRSTSERGFLKLMDSISKHDDGNMDVIIVRSMESGSFQRSRSQLKGVLNDPRVQKLYQESLKMPKNVASTQIENSYRKKLKAYKKNGGGGQAQQYGLHASLFLASEFCDRETCGQLADEWIDWSREQVLSGSYKKRFKNVQKQFQLSDAIAKSLFVRSGSPELLMYANLVLNDQIRQGKTTEEAVEAISSALAEAGWKQKIPRVVTVSLLPFEGKEGTEALASFSVFSSWGELANADADLQLRLINALRNCYKPPSVVDKVQQSVEEAALAKIKEREKKNHLRIGEFKAGTRITVGGKAVKFRFSRQWKPKKSPKKAEAIKELEQIFHYQVPEKLQKLWTEPLTEAKEWINSVPRKGTDKLKNIRIRWPRKEEREMEETEEPKYWIKIEVIKSSAFSGLAKSFRSKDKK